MDVISIVIIVAIAGYVFSEYQRREQEQREILSYLARGERPPEKRERIEGWKVFTAGGVLFLLLGVTGVIGRQGLMAHPRYAKPFLVIAAIGGLLTAIVGLIFGRNLAGYLNGGRSRKEKQQ